MLLRRSVFAHSLPLGSNRVLLVHALTQLRIAVDAAAAALLDAAPFDLPGDLAALTDRFGHPPQTLAGAVAALYERGFLTEHGPEQEHQTFARELDGADPTAALDRLRARNREGSQDYWSARATRPLAALGAGGRRVDVALIGDCDVQREAEALRLQAAERGLDLRAVATFADDLDLVAERRFDAVIVGASRARGALFLGDDAAFLADARGLLQKLRARTAAPILLDGLPEPTVQPLGMAERGREGWRNRVRGANLAQAALAEEFADVHAIDVAHALARAGTDALVDDALLSFTHFGAPGWLLTRPESEKAAVHNLMPSLDRLRADPDAREKIVARAHLDALTTVLALDAKKAVVVDLDGVLWPGVLAETGAPFAWSPEVSGLASHIGVYVGLHEALKTLKRRGVLLAVASKNDEAVVRALWRYPAHYPTERLLSPEDFACLRIGWGDKGTSCREIAAELGFATSALVFIDDTPREREAVRTALPEVEVWGEDLYALRRLLLDDPRLQRPRLTAEAAARGASVAARASRERLRAEAADEAAFLVSLQIETEVFAPTETDWPRVEELFARTTQFNATGAKLTGAELRGSDALALRVRDRFADHGVVGAAVARDGEIVGFALSCRVIGLGVERALLEAMLAAHGPLAGRFVETERNAPARKLYRDAGFRLDPDGLWRRAA